MPVCLTTKSKSAPTIPMVGAAPHRRHPLGMEVHPPARPRQYSGYAKRQIVRTLVTQARKTGGCLIVALKDNTDAGQLTRRLATWSDHASRLTTEDLNAIAVNGGHP